MASAKGAGVMLLCLDQSIRRAPLQYPLVMPRCIFAAGKKSFEVLVRQNCGAHRAKELIFACLPLEEHGWDIDRTRITRVSICGVGTWWKIEKNTVSSVVAFSNADENPLGGSDNAPSPFASRRGT